MRSTGTIAAVAVLLGGGLLAGPPGVFSQEDGDAGAAIGTEHLAAIHLGTCEEPGADPAFVMGIVGPQTGDDGAEADEAGTQGQLTTPPVLTGGGTVEAELDDLLEGGEAYALLVHRSADDLTAPLACAEIAGVVANGQLLLALRPLDRSDYAGVAVLAAADAGGTDGTVLFFSEVDAYDGGEGRERSERAADGTRVPQGGRQGAGGGRAGGGGGGGTGTDTGTGTGGGGGGGGGGQSGIEVTGGVAPEGAGVVDDGDETPRARRTRTPDDASPTEAATGGEPIGTVVADETVEATAAATAEATVEATAAATVEATVPTGTEVEATTVVEPTATETVGELPPAVVDAPPTAIQGEAPDAVVEEAVPTTAPAAVEPAADPAVETPAA